PAPTTSTTAKAICAATSTREPRAADRPDDAERLPPSPNASRTSRRVVPAARGAERGADAELPSPGHRSAEEQAGDVDAGHDEDDEGSDHDDDEHRPDAPDDRRVERRRDDDAGILDVGEELLNARMEKRELGSKLRIRHAGAEAGDRSPDAPGRHGRNGGAARHVERQQ